MCEDEFENFARGVKKIKTKEKFFERNPRKIFIEKSPQKTAPEINFKSENFTAHNFGYVAHLDKTLQKQIKKGSFEWENKIDLHGHTKERAAQKFEEFLKNNFEKSARKLLVITGKGTGAVRETVKKIISNYASLGCILSACSAHISHGGDGAIYIILRKK